MFEMCVCVCVYEYCIISMCVCKHVDFVGISRICPSKMKTSLFVIVAEEADVLDLLSSFPSQSVFRPC